MRVVITGASGNVGTALLPGRLSPYPRDPRSPTRRA